MTAAAPDDTRKAQQNARKAAQRARQLAAGLSEVRGIMAPPELHPAIKEAAKKVQRKGVAGSPKPE